MSYLAMSAATVNFNNESNNENKNPIEQKKTSRNKTIKKRPSSLHKMQKQIGLESFDNDDDGPSPFNPPPKPESVGMMRRISRENSEENDDNDNTVQPHSENQRSDPSYTREAFNNLPSLASEEFYRKMVPYYDKTGGTTMLNKEETTDKLDYLIHLLEEQQDMRTGHVTEELILYSFLGVFIIFVLDSFARAGKYVR